MSNVLGLDVNVVQAGSCVDVFVTSSVGYSQLDLSVLEYLVVRLFAFFCISNGIVLVFSGIYGLSDVLLLVLGAFHVVLLHCELLCKSFYFEQ